ncbi:MAG: alpha/beta fold hydrolase [Pseudomonadota bacterium]
MAPTLAYTVHPGNGPYLALMHGFLSSSRQWLHNLSALSEVCQPVTIDLWGHGHSPLPDDAQQYLPEQYITALNAIRLELGATRWLLCGYSISAGLTIRYTQQFPQHVGAHIFTNSASAFADTAQIAQWRREGPQTAERLHTQGAKAIRRIPVHPRFARRLPKDVYDALLEDSAGLTPEAVAGALLHTSPNACIRDIAPLNPRPALLCFGTFEKRFAPYKDWAAVHMRQLQITSLQAGHAVNMEDAGGFNAAVCEFIEQHSNATADPSNPHAAAGDQATAPLTKT